MRSQNGGGGGGMSADAQLQIEDLNAQVFDKVCFLGCLLVSNERQNG